MLCLAYHKTTPIVNQLVVMLVMHVATTYLSRINPSYALKVWLEEQTPLEQYVFMVPQKKRQWKSLHPRDGYFDDVDIVLHWHPDDNNEHFSSSNGNKSAKFKFKRSHLMQLVPQMDVQPLMALKQ